MTQDSKYRIIKWPEGMVPDTKTAWPDDPTRVFRTMANLGQESAAERDRPDPRFVVSPPNSAESVGGYLLGFHNPDSPVLSLWRYYISRQHLHQAGFSPPEEVMEREIGELLRDPHIIEVMANADLVVQGGGMVIWNLTCGNCGDRFTGDIPNDICVTYFHQDCGQATRTIHANVGFSAIIPLNGGGLMAQDAPESS